MPSPKSGRLFDPGEFAAEGIEAIERADVGLRAAAVVTPDSEVDPARGHALVLYDARNPAFQADGAADRQWEATIAACLVPGLLRRLSWQRLLTFIATVPDLAWLVDALRDKYALLPE